MNKIVDSCFRGMVVSNEGLKRATNRVGEMSIAVVLLAVVFVMTCGKNFV